MPSEGSVALRLTFLLCAGDSPSASVWSALFPFIASCADRRALTHRSPDGLCTTSEAPCDAQRRNGHDDGRDPPCRRERHHANTAGPARLAIARDPCYTGSVANLTITVDDEVLKRARIRALEQGTSVNAILAERLQAFAREGEAQRRAGRALIELAKENRKRSSGRARAKRRGGRHWSRDDLHER